MPGLTVPRSKKFVIQPKNIDGENVGKGIVYTWEQLKEIYSDKASKYDLDTPKGRRAFIKLSRKDLNKKHSPEYQKRLDRETHAKRRADFPEEVRAQERLQDKRNPATKRANNAAYRARKLAAITGQYYIPAFRAELDEIYRAASLFPDTFDVDHIKRLAGNLEELGGKHEPSNLQLRKKKLHHLKTALENSGNFEDAARVGAFNEYNLAPNVRGVLAENVLGKKGLMNFLGDAPQEVKPSKLKSFGKAISKIRSPVGALTLPAVGLSSFFLPPEQAQAAMAIADPIGSALFRGPSMTRNPNITGLLGMEERRMVDPTWPMSTAINTPPKKKRESIWT